MDQARPAIVEYSGEHRSVNTSASASTTSHAATHRFLAKLPGYLGWQWAVVVAAPPAPTTRRSARSCWCRARRRCWPRWVPWEERVQPGDLGPGDLLAPASTTTRGWFPATRRPATRPSTTSRSSSGFGRRQVLSELGRADAAQRWHDGDYGPQSAMARSVRRVCRDCAFYVPLAGSLGTMFGVCANEMSADGHVVDAEYGCGAHSDTPAPAGSGSPRYDPFDDGVLDLVEPQEN